MWSVTGKPTRTQEVRKVIPLPVLQTVQTYRDSFLQLGNSVCFGSLDTSDQIRPLTTQGTAEFLLILPRAPLWEPVQFRAQFKLALLPKDAIPAVYVLTQPAKTRSCFF